MRIDSSIVEQPVAASRNAIDFLLSAFRGVYFHCWPAVIEAGAPQGAHKVAARGTRASCGHPRWPPCYTRPPEEWFRPCWSMWPRAQVDCVGRGLAQRESLPLARGSVQQVARRTSLRVAQAE